MAALTAMGLNPHHDARKTYTFNGGQFNSETGQFTFTARYMNQEEATRKTLEIKRAYSAEVLKSQAARFGWSLKATGPNQYAIQKRS